MRSDLQQVRNPSNEGVHGNASAPEYEVCRDLVLDRDGLSFRIGLSCGILDNLGCNRRYTRVSDEIYTVVQELVFCVFRDCFRILVHAQSNLKKPYRV